MLTVSRPRRRGQRGQALLMALAFIAFFGLATTSVLQLAGTVELQQGRTAAAALQAAAEQGGAVAAAADAIQRSGSGQGSCVAGSSTSLSLAGDQVSYTVDGCPSTNAVQVDQAGQCAVCILGPADVDGSLTAAGPIFVGDGLSGSGSVQSTAGSYSYDPSLIACGPGTTLCSAGSTSPDPVTGLTPGPAGAGTPPLPGPPPPASCRALDDGDGTLSQPLVSGLYGAADGDSPRCRADASATIDWDGSQTQQHFLLANSTIYLNANFVVDNTSVAVEGSGPVTLYLLPGASLTVGGSGSLSGDIRVVADGLTVAAGGTVNLTTDPPLGGYCWVYDESVTVTNGATTVGHARVVVQTNCGAAGPGIVSVAYDP